MNTEHSDQITTLDHLASEVGRVADALEKQNLARRKLLMGVIFGVGTAIGASIIASIVIVLLSRTFSAFGLDLNLLQEEVAPVLEQQLNTQTPQDL